MNLAWPTLLHADDDLGDRELVHHAFESIAVRLNLQWVEDGQAAIDYLLGSGPFGDRNLFPLPSLMLLDLKMPRKNGFEVLAWLRQQNDWKWLPVVIFTGSNSEKDTRRCFEMGANSLIVKPTAYRDLVQCVRDLHHYWFVRNQPVEV